MDNWWPLHPRKRQSIVEKEETKGQCHKVTDLRFIWNLGEREPQRENPKLPCGRWGSASQGRITWHPGGASWSRLWEKLLTWLIGLRKCFKFSAMKFLNLVFAYFNPPVDTSYLLCHGSNVVHVCAEIRTLVFIVSLCVHTDQHIMCPQD